MERRIDERMEEEGTEGQLGGFITSSTIIIVSAVVGGVVLLGAGTISSI